MTTLTYAVLRVGPLAVVAVAVGVLVGIYQYVVSPAADLLLLASVVIGPASIAGLAWLAYRTWYRQRYGKG